MRRLILMRHAKSSWADAGQRDEDRPLNKRGREDAPRMGAWLRQGRYVPDLTLVSTAARTRETWARLGPEFAEIPVAYRSDLYLAEPEGMQRAALAAESEAAVMMIGHMPGIGELARRLLASPPEDPDFGRFPTAAVAVIDFEAVQFAEWQCGRLVAFTVPRRLGEAR